MEVDYVLWVSIVHGSPQHASKKYRVPVSTQWGMWWLARSLRIYGPFKKVAISCNCWMGPIEESHSDWTALLCLCPSQMGWFVSVWTPTRWMRFLNLMPLQHLILTGSWISRRKFVYLTTAYWQILLRQRLREKWLSPQHHSFVQGAGYVTSCPSAS